ncbi:MAG: EamA family transporter [Actinocatenispora sp.]
MTGPTITPWGTYGLLVLCTAFWGATLVVGEVAVEASGPMFVAAGRYLVATVLLFGFLAGSRQRLTVRRGDLGWLALMGAVGVFGYNALYFLGLDYSTASHGALIGATPPVWTVLICALFLGERLTGRRILGVVLGLAGVVLVLQATARSGHDRSDHMLLGDLFLLLAAISWAVYSVLGRRVLTRYSPSQVTAWASLFGTVMFLPVVALLPRPPVDRMFSPVVLLSIGFLAVFSTVVAFVLWNRGVAAIGASQTAIFLNLEPVWGLVLAMVLLHQTVTPLQLGGALLVLVAVFVMQRTGGKARTTSLEDRRDTVGRRR